MKLCEYLKKREISQASLSRHLDYSKQHINAIVRGRKKAPLKFVKAVENYLKLNRLASEETPQIDWDI